MGPLRDFDFLEPAIPSDESPGYFHGISISARAVSGNRISRVINAARSSPWLSGRRKEKASEISGRTINALTGPPVSGKGSEA